MFRNILLCLSFLLQLTLAANALVPEKIEPKISDSLPLPGFAEGWAAAGDIQTFNEKNLYEHINGEAELYYPYGFEEAAFVSYMFNNDPDHYIDADVYKMGSPLDAFGIYSNYRYPEAEFNKTGFEGFGDGFQFMFHQDSYFVRLSTFGDPEKTKKELADCAAAISKKLPSDSKPPAQMNYFKFPGIVSHSEKYLADSLLGYEFFPQGMEAEIIINDKNIRMFVILAENSEKSEKILQTYRDYLNESGGGPEWIKVNDSVSLLTGIDPLHGKVILRQVNNEIAGITGYKDNFKEAAAALDRLVRQMLLVNPRLELKTSD